MDFWIGPNSLIVSGLDKILYCLPPELIQLIVGYGMITITSLFATNFKIFQGNDETFYLQFCVPKAYWMNAPSYRSILLTIENQAIDLHIPTKNTKHKSRNRPLSSKLGYWNSLHGCLHLIDETRVSNHENNLAIVISCRLPWSIFISN